jgi:biopolymer transport protein ExbB/TolQ
METSDIVTNLVDVGALLVGLVTLVVAVLALRSAQSAAQLAEARNEYLLEEQKRLDQLREQHKTLNEELVRERQERWSLQEQLNQEQGQRLEAQRRAELAEQEALRGATQQLREQMDRYLKELEEDTQPGLVRRIK